MYPIFAQTSHCSPCSQEHCSLVFAQTSQHIVTGDWSFSGIVIGIIIIAAIIGILYVALKVFGVQIPQWAMQIFWIVVVAVVAIFAIKFLVSIW